eukprot:m.142727 g.142727  ORF g.142727 m.142727 type:complete len:53 (-) comp14068_c0_seq1:5754-5912(-)
MVCGEGYAVDAPVCRFNSTQFHITISNRLVLVFVKVQQRSGPPQSIERTSLS